MFYVVHSPSVWVRVSISLAQIFFHSFGIIQPLNTCLNLANKQTELLANGDSIAKASIEGCYFFILVLKCFDLVILLRYAITNTS